MLAIPALKMLRQEGHRFKASLGYIARSFLQQRKESLKTSSADSGVDHRDKLGGKKPSKTRQ
jgi:hypothetical protein